MVKSEPIQEAFMNCIVVRVIALIFALAFLFASFFSAFELITKGVGGSEFVHKVNFFLGLPMSLFFTSLFFSKVIIFRDKVVIFKIFLNRTILKGSVKKVYCTEGAKGGYYFIIWLINGKRFWFSVMSRKCRELLLINLDPDGSIGEEP